MNRKYKSRGKREEMKLEMASPAKYARELRRIRFKPYGSKHPIELPEFDDGILLNAGCTQNSYYMTVKHICHSLTVHGVDLNTMSSLPRLLENPIAVIESSKGNGTLIVLIDALDGHGNYIAVVIQPHGICSDGTPANFIMTVYGLTDTAARVKQAIAHDGARYIAPSISAKP